MGRREEKAEETWAENTISCKTKPFGVAYRKRENKFLPARGGGCVSYLFLIL